MRDALIIDRNMVDEEFINLLSQVYSSETTGTWTE